LHGLIFAAARKNLESIADVFPISKKIVFLPDSPAIFSNGVFRIII
jgi:hypothetical protein